MEKIDRIVTLFDIAGEVVKIAPVGSGWINDTYRVSTAGDVPDYVLQRVNHLVFQDVGLLQRNIERVTSHIRRKLTEAGREDVERRVLRVVPTKDGKLYYFDGENYWRMMVFIAGSVTHESITGPLAYLTGQAFGEFQSMLADIGEGALGGKAGFLTNLDGIVRAPLQKAATVTAQWLESIYGYIYKYDQLKAENEQLRTQLAEAQAQAREGQEAIAENERYRDLLGFTQRHTDFELEPANVVSYGASNWSSTLTLSKGSDSGIEVGDCVMNESGALVGQVIETGSTWATVRTVIDVDMSVGGYVSGSGATAMVLGDFTLMQQGCVRFGYLAEGMSIFTGDTVLTSGKGGAFPAGLVVGTITDVRTEAGGQQTYGVITPACDLGELLQVFVIKDFDVVS